MKATPEKSTKPNHIERQLRRLADDSQALTDWLVYVSEGFERAVRIPICRYVLEQKHAGIDLLRPKAIAATTILQSTASRRDPIGVRSAMIDLDCRR
jgi:hypothetical protein